MEVDELTKTCTGCKSEKPATNEFFGRHRGDRLNPRCKACRCAEEAERRFGKLAADPDWRSKESERQQWGQTGVYDALVARQGERCAICGTDEPGAGNRRLAIDHDHETGEVRGLLCSNCNMGMGQLGDSIDRLVAAAAYLMAPPCVDLGFAARWEK